jgi:DNA-binding transcriptional regulator YiaG
MQLANGISPLKKNKKGITIAEKTNVTNTHAFVKPKNSQMTFGEKIKSLRDKYSLTQTDLAETLNAYCKKKKNKVSFSRDMIQKWEDDLHIPSMERALVLSAFFHVSLDTFFKASEPLTRSKIDLKSISLN